jgi:hypothetical protein
MDTKLPCNCPEMPTFEDAGPLPAPGELRAALAEGLGGVVGAWGLETGMDDIPSPGDDLALPPAMAATPNADLQTLIALARANPGLRITLSFDRDA